ncbi:phosphotransferase enzyme family protein [Halomarina halobia]|uniref:Phosphotransferase enzyme family protein n=1 Tax=Halomarina halobia TaxID=3033386 RepID=A0ABD6A9A7_9EURY|nr:phosphotransferase [Halomarina sp. PSR21]
MTRDVHDALASHATAFEVRRELHRVPPHATYEVALDGRRAVCKLATNDEGDPATEARVMEHVARHAPIPVPRILAVGPDYFVAEWLEGVPEEPRVDEAWARAAGAGMAKLHAATAGDCAATGFPRGTAGEGLALDGHPSWTDTLRALLLDCRAFLAARGRDEGSAVAVEVVAFVDEHPEAFAGAGEPVLCHGNWVPDHVGVEDGEVVAAIDFEHALVAPGEYDYWRAALPAFEARGRPALGRAFRAGYESVRPLPDGFARRADLYRMINTVSYLKSLHLQDRHGPAGTARRAEWMTRYVREALDGLRERYA